MKKNMFRKGIAAAIACLMAMLGSGTTTIAATETEAEQKPAAYTAVIESSEGGRFSFQGSEEKLLAFQEGENVYLESWPEEGFELSIVRVENMNGLPVNLAQDAGVFHLVMPASDIRINPVFVPVSDEHTDESEKAIEEMPAEKLEEKTAEEPASDSKGDSDAGVNPQGQKNDHTAPAKKAEADNGQNEETEDIGIHWEQRSKEEVDAMVGMTSAKKRMLFRAASSIVYEGVMHNFYGGATPHLFDSNGSLVYCILPWSSAPNGIPVSFNDYGITSGSDANLQLMAKIMYYGYGGGGNILGGYSESDQEAITHFALSYVWIINMGNTHGLSDWARTGGSRVNETGQAIVMNFLNQVQGLPAVTGTLHIAAFYETSGQMYQDLAYGSFTPEVREGELELSKSSAFPEITKNMSAMDAEP